MFPLVVLAFRKLGAKVSVESVYLILLKKS